jgi:hypothetical protein
LGTGSPLSPGAAQAWHGSSETTTIKTANVRTMAKPLGIARGAQAALKK